MGSEMTVGRVEWLLVCGLYGPEPLLVAALSSSLYEKPLNWETPTRSAATGVMVRRKSSPMSSLRR